MTVLDMGCGPGRITVPLAKKVGSQGKVVAVDIQTGMLRRAEAKAKQAGVENIEFVQANLCKRARARENWKKIALIVRY